MDAVRRLFKALDIRGEFGVDLTTGAAYEIGWSIASSMRRRGLTDVVVGRDNRVSSPALARSLIEGLVVGGCHVVDIGEVATPVVYFAAVVKGHIAGVMVTASHLGPQYNGFKLCIGAQTLVGQDIAELYDLIVAGRPTADPGWVETDRTLVAEYLQALGKIPHPSRPLHVVLDAGNGAAGPFAPPAFTAAGHSVVPLLCTPDGSYPNHLPDPQSAKNLAELVATVRREKADIGFAYDGDADRVGVVDELGHVIAADRIAVLLAREILSRRPGAKFVLDVLCSQVLIDAIVQAGGEAIVWKSGHSLIKSKLHETGAALGVEMSGHMFFADGYYGFDDGIYASLRIAALVAGSGRALSELMAEVPTLFSTPEYRPHCPDDRKSHVVNSVREALAKRFPVTAVDGVRVRFERGWGLLRASNTESVLSLRFEGASEEDANAYREIFRRELSSFPEVDAF